MERQRPLVVLAEDNDELRRELTRCLRADGYEVVEATNGQAIVERFAEAADGARKRPDALVLDFCMPRLSGIGALRIIRHFGPLPPTIVMTAFPDRSVEDLAVHAGASTILWKPFPATALRYALRHLLEARSEDAG